MLRQTSTPRHHEPWIRFQRLRGGAYAAGLATVLALAACESPVGSPEDAPVVANCEDGGCNPVTSACANARPKPGTLKVVSQPSRVSGGAWNGWWTATVKSTANTNGVTYTLEARWNDVPGVSSPIATVTQTVGGANGGFVRTGYSEGASYQDSLAAYGIRSVDLRFVGGSATYPRNGYPSLSAAYADAVLWLRTQGIVSGTLLGYGNSGGSSMLAATLLNQKVPYAGILLGGGPFVADLSACPGKAIADWVFEDIPGGCSQASPKLRSCRSLLGPDGQKKLTVTDVSILVGSSDPKAGSILPQAQMLLAGVQARRETFDRPNVGHQILGNPTGRNALLQRTLEMLR